MKDQEYITRLRAGQVEPVRDWIQTHPQVVNEVDEDGTPMMLYGMETGSEALVRYLVEETVTKVMLRDKKGAGVLHYAARRGDGHLLAYLVERLGFDPLQSDGLGRTPLEIARRCHNAEGERYLARAAGFGLEESYHNPIQPGFMPDPSILRVGEDYYMVNSSFTWYPALPISHSRDLVHWERIGYVFTEENAPGLLAGLESGHGLWAPDISYHEGRFYVTVTLRRNDRDPRPRAQLVTSAPQPQGPYDPPAVLEINGIDPSLFTDVDGHRYMVLNRGARLVPLSDDARTPLGPAELIWGGQDHRASEGPHLLYKDGWYYLLLAEGGTGMGHHITVGRSRSLRGPYQRCPYNPVMQQRDPEAQLQKAGHGDLVCTPAGDWWAVYLCARPVDGFSPLGRETGLDPVRWTPDGWPILNEGRGPSAVQKCPALPPFVPEPMSPDPAARNTFWASQRGPAGARWDGKTLSLPGCDLPLEELDSRAGLFTRQTALHCRWTARLVRRDRGSAGVAAYYDEWSFLQFGVEAGPTGPVLAARLRDGRTSRTLAQVPLETGHSLWLSMEAENLTRRLSYSVDGTNWMPFAVLDRVECLADEGVGFGKRFTGTMLGVYAVGGPADFDHIRKEDLPD